MVGRSSTMTNIKMANYLVLLFLIISFNYVKCDSDSCNFGTCGECISYEAERCVWCSEDNMDGRRCRPLGYDKTIKSGKWCKEKFLVNPQPSKEVVPPQDFGTTKDGATVQFKPQLIKMKARPGVTMKFDMSLKPAEDYPLDVYYLMDISYTMQSKLTDLKNQAIQIHSDLSKYTNNVRLGIGSFVEKPAFPFVDINKKHTSDAFRNEVPLTSNMTIFKDKIDHITFGSNFDDPEAGLDALMQAMKCGEVGWRPNARRIIVLCTDSTYHSAGDGKIVGAIKPHDMQCHLKNNTYSEALTFDYPSVSQINQAAKDGNFRLIFAITENSQTETTPEAEYKKLTSQINGAQYAKLEGGDTVIRIIKRAYEELASSSELTFKAPPFVEVTIDQNCKSEPKINCKIPHKQIAKISGSLKVKACPPDGDKNKKQIVTISPSGLEDKLIIELEVDCECDCEKTPDVADATKCNNAGYLHCGICKCNKGSYGDVCQCTGFSTNQTDTQKCILNNATKPCNGRAKCRCGKCEKCDAGFSGDFCEFDDNSCPKPKGALCSGHGKCTRGQCHCDSYWTGKDCGCPERNSDCYAPYSKQVCSGKGTCVCGKCECDKMEGKNETYAGMFCDNSEERCKDFENYAYCNYMHMGNKEFCDQENNVTTTMNTEVSFVNRTEINSPQLYMAKWCKKVLDANNGTYMVFKYQYKKNNLEIIIQKELETPPEPNYWIAAGSAIGLVLLIGILTVIIWKILVDLHDKKEYEKFSSEALAQGYDVSQNPLYQEPAINFSNPVYNNQCS